MDDICVRLRGICKSFGSINANKDINFEVKTGEIHALLGENGSGKSTLMNILSGIYSPDAGSIELFGKPVTFSSPKDSIRAGIGMVHQHFKLVDVLTAKENIIANGTDKLSDGFFTSGKKMAAKIREIEDKYGLHLDPDKKVYNMSVSEKQTCEILKVLCRGAKILILDEPTAVLTPQEIRVLFDILRGMKKQGCSIIIITHKLAEVLEISDRCTILRKGRSVGTINTADTNARELTELMVGRPISLDIERDEPLPAGGKPLLDVKNLTVLDGQRLKALDDVSFSLSGGEILGVAGIAGSGQKELCETIAGLDRAVSGDIIFKGESIRSAHSARHNTPRHNNVLRPRGSARNGACRRNVDHRQRHAQVLPEPPRRHDGQNRRAQGRRRYHRKARGRHPFTLPHRLRNCQAAISRRFSSAER